MHNHSDIYTSISSLFLAGGPSFSNTLSTIYSGLIQFLSLSFSGTVPLFESMDMFLLMAETALHIVETLTPLPKTIISRPEFRCKYCDGEAHIVPR